MNKAYILNWRDDKTSASQISLALAKANIQAHIDEASRRLFVFDDSKSDIISSSLQQAGINPDLEEIGPEALSDEHDEKHELKADIFTLTAAFLVALAAYILNSPISVFLYIAAWLAAGINVFISFGRSLLKGDIFNESFLMTIATVGALFLGEYPEAVAVMLFYRIGEMFEHLAVSRSHKSITKILDMRPDQATLVLPTGSIIVPPQAIREGDIIEILPGERIPLDAVVISGSSALDTSSLTGESLPVEVSKGSTILSGCINTSGRLTARVSSEYTQSTASKIIELVRSSVENKAPSEKFITRLARVYTPIVVSLAVLLAVIPPLLSLGSFDLWLYRALVFLVASCPCALVVSIPLTFFSGLGNASRNGILIKGGNHLSALANVNTIAFDKTGTLTSGRFGIERITPVSISKAELLDYAAHAESLSSHPLAKAISNEANIDASRIGRLNEWAGKGVEATVDGKIVLAGNAAFMKEHGIETNSGDATTVFVAIDGKYSGSITLKDRVRPEAAKAIAELKALQIKDFAMLTGDTEPVAQRIAAELGINKVFAALMPGEKVDKIKGLPRPAMFVGDGINDAPVLAAADIGAAMGSLGSEAAIEAADVVLMSDQLTKLPQAISISRRTRRIAIENIVFALGIKAAVLTLGALGIASMWAAVFADVGVTLLAVFNSIRALR